MRLEIPYGKKNLAFTIESNHLLGVVKVRHRSAGDAGLLLSRALAGRSGGRLKIALAGKKKILIVVPDSTRSAHLEAILPVLLKNIDDGSRKIDIIIATGLHKRHTRSQLMALLGGPILRRYSVLSHEQSSRSLMRIGETRLGVPIVLNRKVRDYDFIISIGVIEPHLYAGYSGGFKTLAIGLAGEETINATHSIDFLDNPTTKIGRIEKNPFQEALQEIGRMLDLGFSINIVNDPDGKAVRVFCGRTLRVFKAGVNFAKNIFEVNVEGQADIVICGVGYPKDVNLYQASRAINYILNVDRPIIKKGGVLIVAAALQHGVGEGLSEKRFYAELKKMTSPLDFISKTKKAGCVAGVHRAYMVAKPMLDYGVVFVTSGSKGFMESLPFPCFGTMKEALRYAEDKVGRDPKIYVVPRALSTIAMSGKGA